MTANAKWLTPVVTAFDEKGHIDFEANARIYDYLIKSGIDGVVIMGSCGEFFYMNHEEKKSLLKYAIKHINKRIKVIISSGSMLIDEQIDIINCAHDAGADAVMVMSPYYFNLPKDSIYSYYNTIAKSTEANIYIYNFPDRTGYDVTPEITLELVRNNHNIVGYKDSVTQIGHTRAIINTVCDEYHDFEVYSGYDEFFAHNIMSGGAGAVGGISNFAPEICVEWRDAVNKCDSEKVVALQKIIDELMYVYDIEPYFIPMIKAAMILSGLQLGGYCRFPFTPPLKRSLDKLQNLIQKQKLVFASISNTNNPTV